ncbi:MAG: hypothetical protein JW863_05640 [Chitinispirillaceae bacterium]|nr:hypothetical protein [Chitinispirillaceae bacterium]
MHIDRRCRETVSFSLAVFLYSTAGVMAQEMSDYTGPVFPPDHALNTRIDSLPVHPNSDNFIASIGANTSFHPDFGTAWDDGGTMRPMGIPYNVVGTGQPKVPITWTLYGDESDPGPWPIPREPYIETVSDWRVTDDGDRHMLIVDSSAKILYETGNVFGNADGTKWEGGCGAVFDLTSNDLRPDEWTSADAAGLPIFPLLIRYDEVERALADGSEIPHAIRFTVQRSQRAYLWPARHFASSSTDSNRPPMGLRFRLKADYATSAFTPRIQVILRTFKKYGIIVADNGSNWYFQGTHDDRWDDEEISSLKQLRGSDFEAVDISEWLERPGFDTNSAAVPASAGVGTPEREPRFIPGGELLRSVVQYASSRSLAVTYTLPGFSIVRIAVTDLRGGTSFQIPDRVRSAGTYTEEIHEARLSAGICIVQLITGSFGSANRTFAVIR